MISAHAFEASRQWYVSSRLALFHWNGTIKVESIVVVCKNFFKASSQVEVLHCCQNLPNSFVSVIGSLFYHSFLFLFVIRKRQTWDFVLHLRDFVLGDFGLGILSRGILSGYHNFKVYHLF